MIAQMISSDWQSQISEKKKKKKKKKKLLAWILAKWDKIGPKIQNQN